MLGNVLGTEKKLGAFVAAFACAAKATVTRPTTTEAMTRSFGKVLWGGRRVTDSRPLLDDPHIYENSMDRRTCFTRRRR